MLKRLLPVVLSLIVVTAHAQFTPGQILTAAQLNSALSAKFPISGGTLTGPLTVPSLSVTGSPIPVTSGGTGAATATGATTSLQYLAPFTGAVARSLSSKFGDEINVLDFGADPTYTNDSTAAFRAWWTACISTKTGAYGGAGGNYCFIPAGHYKLQSLIWDFAANPGGGTHVYGAGENATVLDFSATSGAYLYTHNSANEGWYYATFDNFGVYAANTTAGDKAAWQINPDPSTSVSDAANSIKIDQVYVGNSTGCLAGSSALAINNLYGSHINISTYNFGCAANSSDAGTNPSGGDSLYLNGVAYNTFSGSMSTATNGIHLTASSAAYSQANTFLSPAIENVYHDVTIDNQYVRQNTFIGGQWVFCTAATSCPSGQGYAINASAGYSNVFINPNTTLSPLMPTGACSSVTVIAGGGPYGSTSCNPQWLLANSAGNFQFALSGSTGYLTNNASGSIHIAVPSGNSVAVDVNGANVANFGYWANGYQNAAPVAIGALPTCNSSAVGTMAWVNNGIASPTYHQAVSTTGSAVFPVYCTYNGTAYNWVY
jgi:hypothetical protein